MERARSKLLLALPLAAAVSLGGCDEDEGPEAPASFISATLVGRSGNVDFSGAATLTTDDTTGHTTCRATNDEGYGLSLTWAAGTPVVDTPIELSQEVSITTEAPGMPGVLVDDFFQGELTFTAIEENFEGTFRADAKVEGEERAIMEVPSGEFLCAKQAPAQGESEG